jgi:hypothetical protein
LDSDFSPILSILLMLFNVFRLTTKDRMNRIYRIGFRFAHTRDCKRLLHIRVAAAGIAENNFL